jgi:hypothetical protein
MKIIKDEKKIQRNSKIGAYTSLGALIVLGLGMYVSFAYPEQFYISLGALAIGFFLSQVGIYFGNRWGRKPRIDELIDANLKGLPGDHTLYHYNTTTAHLLVGQAGVWVLMPYYQRGKIVYETNRWKQKGGGFLLSYLKFFAQEGLGRPDLEVPAEIENLKEALTKSLGDNLPPIHAALIFTDDRAEIAADNAPYPTLAIKKLKDHLRGVIKDNPLPKEMIAKIKDALPKEEKKTKDEE